MDTPRAQSPPPLPPRSSEPTAPLPPPPPPLPPLSGASSPSSSHDFAFAFSFYSAFSSPFGGHHLHPVSSMSRAPIGRVVSDIGHNHKSYSKQESIIHHPTTGSHGTNAVSKDDRSRAKNRTAPYFFSGLGGAWTRKESSSNSGSDDTAGGKTKRAEEKKRETTNNKAKQRALNVGQWVKKHVTAMVEQLRSSYRPAEREQKRRHRPHSFSGHAPNAARRTTKEWLRSRGQQLSSAPASLRASPANSGHLSVGGSVNAPKSSEESTMEELQSAIEAAIAHCKNSISRDQSTSGRRPAGKVLVAQ